MTGSLCEAPEAYARLRRIRLEFLEMPGLRLTPTQARRLWSLDAGQCEALLGELVTAGFLTRSTDGSFVRPEMSVVEWPAE